MKKILFISPTLGGGGAERVLSYIIQWLSKEIDYDIHLLLLNKDNNDYLRVIPDNVKINYINLGNKISLKGLKVIKSIISINPDICFTGYYKLNLLLAPFIPLLKLLNIKFIARETCIPSLEYKDSYVIKLYRHLYSKFDKIICQSIDMYEDLISLGLHNRKLTIINNPIVINSCFTDISKDNDHSHKPHLLAIGRLTEQKGYGLLLENINRMKPLIPFYLTILGKGPLYENIKNYIQSNYLYNDISLMGFSDNPYSIIQKADGLILSSKYEGFPNVILEANYFGKPVFSNRCLGGINEIIKEGINGFTADFNHFNDFSSKLNLFLKTHFNARQIHDLTVKRYSGKIIFPKYKQLFDNI